MSKYQYIEEKLKIALEANCLSKEFDEKLEESLRTKIKKRSFNKNRTKPIALRLAWVFGVLFFVILSVTLVLGPDRVWAQVQKLLGYFPGVGFVDPESVMVLDGQVAQQGPGNTLTIKNSLIQDGVVKIWAEYSEKAENPGEVWLNYVDGSKVRGTWSYEPDVQGTRGMLFVFHTDLPAESIIALTTKSGWNIPLSYQSGTDAFPPVENASLPGQEACQSINSLRICAISNHFEGDSLEVLLEITSEDGKTRPYAEVSGLDYRDILPDFETSPSLTDENGKSISATVLPQPAIQTSDNAWTITLLFEGLSQEIASYRLELPGLMYTYPVSDVVRVDVGSQPKPGQSFKLDKTITVQDLALRFDHAELISGGAGDLTLMAYTQEIDSGRDRFILGLEQGPPDNGQDMYGTYFDGKRYALTMEIGKNKGNQTGIINMNVISAIIYDGTKINIPVKVNESSLEPVMTSIPEIVDGFQTPQVLQSLDMSRFTESGEILESGELLYSIAGADCSSLYAFNPNRRNESRLIATVPGKILDLFLLEDGALYYTIGEMESGDDFGQPKQLYRYIQGQGAPELVFAEFPGNIDPSSLSVSHLGRYLSFRTYEQIAGSGTDYRSKIVRLDRCEGGICPVNLVEGFGEYAGWQISVGANAWSPDRDALILYGTNKDDANKSRVDLFIMDLEDFPAMNLIELSEGHEVLIENAFWSLDGESIYLLRNSGLPASNLFALDQINVLDKSFLTISRELPWNMSEVIELKDGSFIDSWSVIDLESQQIVIRHYHPGLDVSEVIWRKDFFGKSEILGPGLVSADGKWVVFRRGIDRPLLFDMNKGQFVESVICEKSSNAEYCTFIWKQ